MAVKQATCDIVIAPTLGAKSTRRRAAEVNMDIFAGISAGPQPIRLVIKSKNLARVIELLALYKKSDAELAEAVHGTELASEVEGKTIEEIAAWVRGNVLAELQEMARE